MSMICLRKLWWRVPVILVLLAQCKDRSVVPSKAVISELRLKEGALIACGPPDEELGTVVFETSCAGGGGAFNQGVELLHSFEYDEAEKVFAGIIDRNPGCAMAYWGVAMSNFHPLWAPPTGDELKKGAGALVIAQGITQKSKREQDYINALAAYYSDWERVDHLTRCRRFEAAMDALYRSYPADTEAAIFYALALTAAADPADKSRSKQRKAGALLTAMAPKMPHHPGIIHYLIHTYDYPELADLALPAARKYAAVAPSSAHALHMPSHIFTRLGLWDDCIASNLVSVASARCYAEAAGIKGHWDEELHGMDYLVYAYLQKGEDSLAKQQWDSLAEMKAVYPMNFKVAYAFAAIPSRYLLERRDWAEAAHLTLYPANFPWKDFPWQEAIFHFTRGLGAAHLGRIDSAKAELAVLGVIHDRLVAEKDNYKAGQVLIQMKTLEAWTLFQQGKVSAAVTEMRTAADLEDRTEKHPVTPCEVLPAQELLGDLLLAAGRPREALEAYTDDLKGHPGRRNGLHGAALAGKALHVLIHSSNPLQGSLMPPAANERSR